MEKQSDNLSNFYIMPLLKLNKKTFSDNFINSYVSNDHRKLIVKLKNNIEDESIYKNHVHYDNDFLDEENNLIVLYRIPRIFRPTIALFKEGKYSKFSPEVKNLIIKYSGLPYKQQRRLPNAKPSDKPIMMTARPLAALEKSRSLRIAMEKELNVKISKDAELMSIPNKEEFYSF